MRVAASIRDVFEQSPYETGYDLKLGTDDNGRIDSASVKQLTNGKDFKHGLVMVGGLGGLHAIVDQEEESGASLEEIIKLFDIY